MLLHLANAQDALLAHIGVGLDALAKTTVVLCGRRSEKISIKGVRRSETTSGTLELSFETVVAGLVELATIKPTSIK